MFLFSGCFSGLENNDFQRFDSIEEERLYHLLVDSEINTIYIDIDFVGDRKPPKMAIEAVIENLNTVVPNKNVVVPEPTIIYVADDSEAYVWNIDEIYGLSQAHRHKGSNNEITIHILILNGRYEETTVGGFFLLDFIAIFPQIFVFNQPEVIRGVLVHEMGHALGLVNYGAPMVNPRLPPKEDDSCQCHSTQESSPLYYKFSSVPWLLERIQDGKHIPYKYNNDDLADIEEFKRRHKGSWHSPRRQLRPPLTRGTGASGAR